MSFARQIVLPVNSTKFSDANINITGTSPAEKVFDDDSVNASILTILSTPVGSRVFNRTFGSNIDAFRFEPMDSVTADRIKYEIINRIGAWETRIALQRTDVVPDYANNQYYVEMEYTIPALKDKNVTLKFNLVKE